MKYIPIVLVMLLTSCATRRSFTYGEDAKCRVLSSKTKEPIENAKIKYRLVKFSKYTSDRNGNFELEEQQVNKTYWTAPLVIHDPPVWVFDENHYVLEISAAGFEDQEFVIHMGHDWCPPFCKDEGQFTKSKNGYQFYLNKITN